MSRQRSADWHPVMLVGGLTLSLTLLLSWFLEPTRPWWLAADEWVFWTLHGMLDWGRVWQILLAAVNATAGDLIPALIVIGLFTHFVLRQHRDRLVFYFAVGVMIAVLLVAGSQIGHALGVGRSSPTLAYPEAPRLSELVPWIQVQDTSPDSFPGDHATVLLISAGALTFYLSRGYALVGWMTAFVFVTPRLIAGGHWLSDDLAGSVAMASLVLSCVLATPLHRVVTEGLEHALLRVGAWLRGGSRGAGRSNPG